MQVRTRKQKTIAFSANNKVAEDLGRGLLYREFMLRLSATPTLTAGNNVYANILAGDEWAVVKRIQVTLDGDRTIFDMSGNALRWLNLFQYGAIQERSVLLGAGGANPVCSSGLILPFWLFPEGRQPLDTMLDARRLSSLEIEVEWGQYTDIAASASAWTTEPSLDVYSSEAFGVPEAARFSTQRRWTIEKTISATESRFQVKLPVGPVYRGFLINTTDAAADDGDVINNFKLISGSTVFADLSEEILGLWHPQRRGLLRGFSGTAFDDLFIGDANSYAGWYYYNHCMDGLTSEGIDTLGLSEFIMELDVTVGGGTTKVFVHPITVEPVRAAA